MNKLSVKCDIVHFSSSPPLSTDSVFQKILHRNSNLQEENEASYFSVKIFSGLESSCRFSTGGIKTGLIISEGLRRNNMPPFSKRL